MSNVGTGGAEKLTRDDWRLVAGAAVLIVLSYLFASRNFERAFPEASIDLKLSRDQITARARDFLSTQKLSVEGFRQLTLFDPDQDAAIYLEREVGLEEANRLMSTSVAVWRWRARWFKPPEKVELIVRLWPDGRLSGFEHVIAENAPGARLATAEARGIAERFLAQQTQLPHRLIEEKLIDRPARHDHEFTWEQTGFRAAEATYRRKVTVLGDKAWAYDEFLHVPEQWQRDFEGMRSRNELYAGIAQALYVPLAIAALAIILLRLREIPWRHVIVLSAGVACLMTLTQCNSLPFTLDSMPTSSPLHESLLIGLLGAAGAGAGIFFYIALAAAAGAPLYNRAYPNLLPFQSAVWWSSIRSREFFRATVAGYGFAALHVAFIVAFYLVGRRVGVWSPQDVQYSNLLSTWAPWLYPLTISAIAATSEEFWFRLLAVPLLERYTRSRWIAILVPAFIWGFLHANYPQQPAYIRGVEVGLIGVAAGWMMLRFGIVATLVWHYTIDAVLIGMFLLRSESLYFQLSGWLVGGVIAVPLVVSLILHRRYGGFAEMPLPEPVVEEVPTTTEERPKLPPLEPRLPARYLYAAAAVLALVGLAARSTRFGDFIRVRITADQAAALANPEFKSLASDSQGWRSVTDFIPNLPGAELEYLRRVSGANEASRIIQERVATGIWRTRFFRPLQPEEWVVYGGQNGKVFRVDHVLDEKAPGARLSQNDARAALIRYLHETQGLPMDNYREVDAREIRRDQRTDHEFVWEDKQFRAGDATARVSVELVGDRPSEFRRFLKLPEEWLREFTRPRIQGFLIPGMIGAFALPLIVTLIRRLTHRGVHYYHWRVYGAVAGVIAVCLLAGGLNGIPSMLRGYDTALPLENYVSQYLLGRVISLVLLSASGFLAALALDVFLQMATGLRHAPRPAIAGAIALAAIGWGFLRFAGLIDQWIPGPRHSLPLWSITGLDTAAPAVAILTESTLATLTTLLGLGIAVLGGAVRFAPVRRVPILLGVALVIAVGRAGNLWQGVSTFVVACAAFLIVAFVIRTRGPDWATIAVALFWLECGGRVATLVIQPSPSLVTQGVIAAAIAVMAGCGLLLLAARGQVSGRSIPA